MFGCCGYAGEKLLDSQGRIDPNLVNDFKKRLSVELQMSQEDPKLLAEADETIKEVARCTCDCHRDTGAVVLC